MPQATPLLSLLTLAGLALQAQAADTLRQVTLHPQGATIERALTLAPNAREARFSCLSPELVADSLQLLPAPDMGVGEIRLELKPAELLPECDRGSKVRELEQQSRQLQAESEALAVSLNFLKQLTGKELPPGAKLSETLETLRRQTLDQLQRQQAHKERMESLDRQLAQAREQEGDQRQYQVLSVPVDTLQGGELRLRYRSEQAGWTPLYRARLDTATGQLNLERRAEVSQQTGEDWSNVSLRLSTELGRPQGGPGYLSPWLLDIRPKQEPNHVYETRPVPMAAPAPMAKAESVAVSGSRVRTDFRPEVFVGEFASEYAIPTRQRLLSGARPLQLSLGKEAVDTTVYSRVQPQVDSAAFLIAELARPAGSWPRGKLQLYRDGLLVGESQLFFSGEQKVDWVFGRDDRLRVRRLPERLEGANAGLISQRQERQVERVYEVESRADKPLPLLVLEASPVSQHADIRIEAQLSPEPQAGDWREQRGIRAWRQTLAPRQTQRFTARYKLSAPADAQVTGWR
ncbi:mucoidy inhibitor MuiA family protein [Roseateles sp. DB2]|uniref:mucoidy inhibitor MuiA family protein n=1 Tax=Roseateles sp. DB2 TaxID=3453717 RepID=UPI003EEDD8C9